MSVRYVCSRCGAVVVLLINPVEPPTCSCGLDDNGRDRLTRKPMTKDPQ